MKQLCLFTLFSIFCIGSLQAQESLLEQAQSQLKGYKIKIRNPKDTEADAYLLKAKAAIDEAVKDAELNKLSQTYMVRSEIYIMLASHPRENAKIDPIKMSSLLTSSKAVQKGLNLQPVWEEQNAHDYLLRKVFAQAYNAGFKAYQEDKDYETALKLFYVCSESHSRLEAKDAASVEQYKDVFKSMIQVYRFFFSHYYQNKEKEKAFGVIQTAQKFHPTNVDLIIEEFNYYLYEEMEAEMIALVKEKGALTKEHPNIQHKMYYNVGSLLRKHNKLDEGIEYLEKAIALDPEAFLPLNDIAKAYQAKAKPHRVAANNASGSEQEKLIAKANKEYGNALTYLFRAYDVNEDPLVAKSIAEVYEWMGNKDKSAEWMKKAEEY